MDEMARAYKELRKNAEEYLTEEAKRKIDEMLKEAIREDWAD